MKIVSRIDALECNIPFFYIYLMGRPLSRLVISNDAIYYETIILFSNRPVFSETIQFIL